MTAAAIDTLTLCWSAIRDEFRARLRGLHVAPLVGAGAWAKAQTEAHG